MISRRKIILLRILKVIKAHQAQLKTFPSYFYKNVLFKFDEENPAASWDRADLADRFVFTLTSTPLKQKSLFEGGVNINNHTHRASVKSLAAKLALKEMSNLAITDIIG